MKLATGTVVGGKVVLDGPQPFPDGMVVTVLAKESGDTFEVPVDLEAELIESLAEADRGETITADELLRRLRQPK
ncbi:MAG: hypothetical protein JNJ89_02805 [Rubrivivax sp.]|nr:hypothetical protein [Rubrivivax sp.]